MTTPDTRKSSNGITSPRQRATRMVFALSIEGGAQVALLEILLKSTRVWIHQRYLGAITLMVTCNPPISSQSQPDPSQFLRPQKSNLHSTQGKFRAHPLGPASDNSTNPTDHRSPPHTHNTAAMGRLHSKGKGISSSAVPYSRNPPAWLKTTPEQVVEQICKLAKKGATPSQIGVVLRDSHGVAQVKVVTGMFFWTRFLVVWFWSVGSGSADSDGAGNKILRILKSNGMD